jgi:hypothetical protein
MTAQQIIDLSRAKLDDTTNPPLWSTAELVEYMTECIEEICESPYEVIHDSYSPGVCNFTIYEETTYHVLDASVIKVLAVRSSLRTSPLQKLTVDWLDRNQPDWRNMVRGTSYGYLLDETTGYLRFVPLPGASAVITLSVVRYPLTAITVADLSVTPGIHRKYHRKLIPGILSKAYQKNDSETKDPNRSAQFGAEWERNKVDILIDITQERSISSEDAPPYDANSIYNQV